MGEKRFRMPALGADMKQGTLVEWAKSPGEPVARNEIIAVIETDKGLIEVESFDDGTFVKPLVEIGTRAHVGDPLAILEVPGFEGEDSGPATEPPASSGPEPTPPAPTPAAAPSAAPGGHVHAVPRARKRAAELGLDITTVTPADGELITVADVDAASAALGRPEKATGARPDTGPDTGPDIRRAIAAAMAKSKREIPHYYLSQDVEMSAALAWLEAYNAERPPPERVLSAAVLARAVALAATKHPALNGVWADEGAQPSEVVNLGFAVSLRRGGLIAPCIFDAQAQPIPELMASIRDLVARARSGKLKSREHTEGTLTLTNLGDESVDVMTPIIQPPQLAIVGAGQVRERPWVVDGAVVPRPVLTLTLAADHRASDGHTGARFLREVARLLQSPEAL